MKLFLGSDHGAFDAKEFLMLKLKEQGFEIDDVGTYSTDSCAYSEFAISLTKKVVQADGRGILLCGSGIGVSMAANRFQGARAALCRTVDDAKLSREHNNANILCLGARVTPLDQLLKIVEVWLATKFEGGRHVTRIELFDQLGGQV